jgi:hypothetical protein
MPQCVGRFPRSSRLPQEIPPYRPSRGRTDREVIRSRAPANASSNLPSSPSRSASCGASTNRRIHLNETAERSPPRQDSFRARGPALSAICCEPADGRLRSELAPRPIVCASSLATSALARTQAARLTRLPAMGASAGRLARRRAGARKRNHRHVSMCFSPSRITRRDRIGRGGRTHRRRTAEGRRRGADWQSFLERFDGPCSGQDRYRRGRA